VKRSNRPVIGYLVLAALAGLAAVVLSDTTGGASWLLAPALAGAASAALEWRAGASRARIERVGVMVAAIAFGTTLVWLVVVLATFGV